MNMKKSKTNETHKFVLNLSQRFDWRRLNKHRSSQLQENTEDKHIRKQYKNNKVKIIAPTWNDEFELPDGSYSVSEIHDYIEHIIRYCSFRVVDTPDKHFKEGRKLFPKMH